jgi:hypothetical protein
MGYAAVQNNLQFGLAAMQVLQGSSLEISGSGPAAMRRQGLE